MTTYFAGPKPGLAGKAASLAANEGNQKPAAKTALKAAPKTAPAKVPLPPSLNPAGDKRFVTVREHTRAIPVKKPQANATPANTVSAEPAPPKHGDSQRFYRPLSPGQKPSGYEAVGGRPGRAGIGSPVRSRPYWLATRGPAGDTKSQLNAAQIQTARKAGVGKTIAMKALEGAVHPLTDLSRQATGERPVSLSGALSDTANIASNFVPVGKAAGILGGLRGLKALKAAKVGVDAAEAGKAVAPVAEEAAALRGAVSGKPAKQALKTMGPNEKVGALIDDPNMGKSVRQLQKEQKQLYSQERAKRAAAANVHLNNQDLAPEERIRLAKHELRGELPKIKFQGFTELSDPAVAAMQKHILDHPHLMPFQKITASSALTNALTEGKLPTPSELGLLEHVFGKDATTGLAKLSEHPFRDTILSTLNVPRSLMSSFDLSAPFRQGLVVSTRHPALFAKNFKPMLKSFGSEKVYQTMLDDIQHRPSYPLMMKAKLSLTDLGHAVGDREERFASDVAEKMTGGKYSPVRASGRAYTGFLDKTRADVFDHLIQRAQSQGININDDHFLESLGKYVNSATGRGDLGRLQEAGKVMNAVFFSPRLMASRLNFLNPAYYAKLDPFARKEALRSAIQLAGTVSTLLSIAAYGGAKVVSDPRNPDWGKIRIGNTRIDLAGGFQQYLRLFAQLATGTAISSTTGKKLNLTAGGFGQPNRLDLFLRFFEGKENPISSFVTDAARGQDQVGNKFHLKTEIQNRLIPLLAQDSHDLYKEHHGGMNGLAAAFAGYGIGSVGFGLQTYGPGKPKGRAKTPQEYFGASSGSSGSPYFASSSTSSNSGYFGTP